VTDELPRPSERQLEYFRDLLRRFTEEGTYALVEQFCVWANTYIRLSGTGGETARQVRAEQVFPVAVILCQVTGLEVEDVIDVMHDEVVRGLFQAKMEGRHDLSVADAEEALVRVIGILSARVETH
jgi:hypothetical protein